MLMTACNFLCMRWRRVKPGDITVNGWCFTTSMAIRPSARSEATFNWMKRACTWKTLPSKLQPGNLNRRQDFTAAGVLTGACAQKLKSEFQKRSPWPPPNKTNLAKLSTTKNFGDAFASPCFYFDQAQLVFLLGGLFCFLFGCHVNYSPFHCSWIDATVFCCDCLNV